MVAQKRHTIAILTGGGDVPGLNPGIKQLEVRSIQLGMKAVGIPKTMDNDVTGTDYCIGFSTAVTRSVGFIHALRTSAGSHERIAVVELFGRYCGETSLISGYLAGADRTVISESENPCSSTIPGGCECSKRESGSSGTSSGHRNR
jgi:6-phosphofructokinase